ncbi:MAG: hypothetical protein K2O88_02760 [Paramuribaculum sp.]|nr:hypothetical protein [Paramuribaculum sp.]
MKKLLLILTLVTAAVISLTTQSCSSNNQNYDKSSTMENVSMDDFRAMAREAYDSNSEVNLSYDSLNNRVLLRTHCIDSYDFIDSIKDNIIPLTAIVLGTTFPGVVIVLIFFLTFRYFRQRRLDRYKVIEHAISSGVQLPDSFYLSESTKNTNTPRSAIVWIGWGLSITLFFLCTTNEPLAAFGLIPLFIGIARGVTYLINRHDQKQKEAREREESTPLFLDFDEMSEQK